ncbi:hypothetical protein ACJX0J_036534 [Zea mays]
MFFSVLYSTRGMALGCYLNMFNSFHVSRHFHTENEKNRTKNVEWKRHIIYHFQAILCCMLCSLLLGTYRRHKVNHIWNARAEKLRWNHDLHHVHVEHLERAVVFALGMVSCVQYLHAHCFTQYPIFFLSMPLVVIFHYKDGTCDLHLSLRYMQVWLNAMFSEIRDFTISYPNLFLIYFQMIILVYLPCMLRILFYLFEKEDKKGMFGVYFFMHACTMGISPILQVPGVPIITTEAYTEPVFEKNRTKNVEWKRHIIYHFQAILCCMLCSLPYLNFFSVVFALGMVSCVQYLHAHCFTHLSLIFKFCILHNT